MLFLSAYTAHPTEIGRNLLPQTCFTPRIDQGERLFNLRIECGNSKERMQIIETDATIYNIKPFAISFFPCEDKLSLPKSGVALSDKSIQLTCVKANKDKYILRLFNPNDKVCQVSVAIEALNITENVTLAPFEVATFQAYNEKLDPTEMLQI